MTCQVCAQVSPARRSHAQKASVSSREHVQKAAGAIWEEGKWCHAAATQHRSTGYITISHFITRAQWMMMLQLQAESYTVMFL